jgi:hypothetical protein
MNKVLNWLACGFAKMTINVFVAAFAMALFSSISTKGGIKGGKATSCNGPYRYSQT